MDGREFEADESRTILDVARENGIEIPTLCHHRSLPPYGACRLCLVEVIWGSKSYLYTSCTYPAWEGMVVHTASEKVLRARKLILELMLAEAPASREIKDLAARYGVSKTRFKAHRAGKDNKCVLCGLCARLCQETLLVSAVGFAGRGDRRRVVTPFAEMSEVCTTCGTCVNVCPTGAMAIADVTDRTAERIPSEFDAGLVSRPCIYTPFPQAVPNKPVIDRENCMYFLKGTCRICQDVCPADAIDYSQEDRERELEVGSVIIATGCDLFDPSEIKRLGYGALDRVYTSLEFERLNNAAGPTEGKIIMRNGKEPKSVAIVHCVGSRDQNYQEYCSKVCCMYSLKFAHLIREKTGADVYNFYIDMRTGGKRYEEFYKRLCEEGVRFIRGKVTEVTDKAESPDEKGKMIVVAEDTLLGQMVRVPVDMVILSPALKAREDAEEVARTFRLARDASGFFLEKHPKLAPVETATDGIFIAGTCSGPMDIPESVAQGKAAASAALSLASRGRVEVESATAQVIEELCSGCQICVELCSYSAVRFDEKRKISRVNEAICKGCGTCVAGCPSGAMLGKRFAKEQIMAEIDGVLS
jgi:heterodisulfide reductase subunit A